MKRLKRLLTSIRIKLALLLSVASGGNDETTSLPINSPDEIESPSADENAKDAGTEANQTTRRIVIVIENEKAEIHYESAQNDQRPTADSTTWPKRIGRFLARQVRADRIIAFGTIVAVITVLIQQHDIETTERPWIGLGSVAVSEKPTPNKVFMVNASVLNSGHSPGVHSFLYATLSLWEAVEGDTRVPLIDDPVIAACRLPKPKWSYDMGGDLVLPGATNLNAEARTSSVIKPKVADFLLTPDAKGRITVPDFADIPHYVSLFPANQQWKIGIYLVGCIDYFDEFHHAHRTSICYFYRPPADPPFPYAAQGSFNACAKGNDAD